MPRTFVVCAKQRDIVEELDPGGLRNDTQSARHISTLIRASRTLYGALIVKIRFTHFLLLVGLFTNEDRGIDRGNLHDVAKTSATALYTAAALGLTMMQSCASSASSVMVAPIFSAALMPWSYT